MVDDAAVSRIKIERISQPLIVRRRFVPRDGIVARRCMIVHAMRHAADLADAIHSLRQLRQMLTDLHSRHDGIDRLIGAAHRIRRGGLHIKGVELTGPAPLKKKNDGLRADLQGRRLPLGPQQPGLRQSQQAHAADSLLLVRQLTGEYRVKSPGLRPLAAAATRLIREFDSVEINHVRREFNEVADALANAALDR